VDSLAVTSGLIAVLEQHKFIVLLKGMRDMLSKLNLLNVSMQTQSLPFSTLKVLVKATREGLKREWIDLSAPTHPMLVSGACVTGGDSFKKLVEQMKSGGLDQDDSDDKTFELVSSGGVKRKIGEGEQHTIPVQGSCTEHAEAVKLLSTYAKGVRQSLQARFVDINDLSLFDVLHSSRVPKSEEPTFDDFGVQQVRGLLEIYGKDIEKGGHRYPALLSDSTLPQYEVYKKLVWEHYRCCCRTWPHLRCSWPRGIRLRKFCVFVAEYTKFYVLKRGVLKVTLLTFFLSLLYSKMHLIYYSNAT